MLLKIRGIKINSQDLWGSTPLHNATSLGHAEVTALLLAHGADTTIMDKYGHRAIDVAANEETKTMLMHYNRV